MVRVTAFAVAVGLFAAAPVVAQQMPTTQPAMLDIYRELEKPGHSFPHQKIEARWAELNRKQGFPYTYLALVATSGTPEIWWVNPYGGAGEFGKSLDFGSDNPTYTNAIGQLAVEDGEHLASVTRIQAVAVPEASYGTFPSLADMRVYSILTIQMRYGYDQLFTDIAKQYAAIVKAKGVQTAWRAYQVIGGAPDGTFLIFSSFASWDAVEANRKAMDAAFGGAAPADLESVMKTVREGVVSSTSRFFTVNASMSLVSKELAASNPFWKPKVAAVAKKVGQ
jgi:hypothetical protein